MTEAELLNLAKQKGISVFYESEEEMKINYDGCIVKNKYGCGIFIKKKFKGTPHGLHTLAHEIAHYLTNTMHKIGASPEVVQENEKIANRYVKRVFKIPRC